MRLVPLFILVFYALAIRSYTQDKISISIPEVFGNGKKWMLNNACFQAYKDRNTVTIERDSLAFFKQRITQCILDDTLIKHVDISFVCCEEGTGNWTMYAGIDTTLPKKRNIQHISNKKLPVLYHQLYDSLLRQIQYAVETGNTQEDLSQGHSLMNYEPAKKIQLRCIDLAKRNMSLLKSVLLHSIHNKERVIAAYMIAYYPRKDHIIPILIQSCNDPNENVRNNAIRSLSSIANSNQLNIDFSKYDLKNIVKLLNSNKWTDKNKSSLFLSAAFNNHNRVLSAQLRRESLSSLKEMALWRNNGHAFPAYLILGKLAGWNDEQIFNALSENRKTVIEKMLLTIQ